MGTKILQLQGKQGACIWCASAGWAPSRACASLCGSKGNGGRARAQGAPLTLLMEILPLCCQEPPSSLGPSAFKLPSGLWLTSGMVAEAQGIGFLCTQ